MLFTFTFTLIILHFEFQASGDNKFESNQENKCDHFSTTSLDE